MTRKLLSLSLALLLALFAHSAPLAGADDTTPQAAPAGAVATPPSLSVTAVAAQLDTEIAVAAAALAATHDAILAEKKQLAADWQRLRDDQRDLDAALTAEATKAQALQRERAEQERELRQLQEIARQLLAMSRDFAANQQLGEGFGPELATTRTMADCAEGLRTAAELSPAAVTALLRVASARVDERLGGVRGPGLAYGADGMELQGEYLRYGPLLYFWPPGSMPAGLAALRLGSAAPTLFSRLEAADQTALASLRAGEVAQVPMDLSMGQAISLREQEDSLLEHYLKGGPVMIPILFLALMCLVLILWRVPVLLRLPSARAVKRVSEVVALVRDGRIAEAEKLADGLGRPLSTLVRAGVAARGMGRDSLEELLYEQTLLLIPPLGRSLSALAVSASAAPLLGLLGTVTGIIHTFQLITVYGSGDARLLSSGISEALITTEAGLLVAIPALLIHAWCTRRVRHMSTQAQEAAICLLNGLTLNLDEPALGGLAAVRSSANGGGPVS